MDPVSYPGTQQSGDASPASIDAALFDLLKKINQTNTDFAAAINTAQTTAKTFLRSSVLRSAPVALVSNTAKTITSITIPAKSSWLISGGVGFVDGTGTTHTVYRPAISRTTNTLPSLDTIAVPTNGEIIAASFVGGMALELSFAVQSYRFDNTTDSGIDLFLIGFSVFAVNTCSAFGAIEAMKIA